MGRGEQRAGILAIPDLVPTSACLKLDEAGMSSCARRSAKLIVIYLLDYRVGECVFKALRRFGPRPHREVFAAQGLSPTTADRAEDGRE
jgi:hypothetical protein